MSEENVELVRTLLPPSGTDIVPLIRDEAGFALMRAAISPLLTDDFRGTIVFPSLTRPFAGLEGFRGAWLDWLEPWATYRSTIEELIDAGDCVVAVVRDYGRREGMDEEVELIGAAIWTIRDGKAARYDGYANRAEALKAAGLSQ
jgi:ketosteroid isomerase-like protein